MSACSYGLAGWFSSAGLNLIRPDLILIRVRRKKQLIYIGRLAVDVESSGSGLSNQLDKVNKASRAEKSTGYENSPG